MNDKENDAKIRSILESLNIKYNDFDLFKTAFTHQSYSNEHGVKSNQRLEYLGDAVLDFLVADYLYHKYPDEPEGNLTKIRAKYVCTKANSEYAIKLKLNECILLGKGESEQGGKHKQSLLADLFEAFLGAVYLDQGIEKVRLVLEEVVFPVINNQSVFFVDYKSKLQEYIQAESKKTVEYVIIKDSGPAHNKTFTVAAMHGNVRLGVGVGKSKKDAEQKAAEDALKKLSQKIGD